MSEMQDDLQALETLDREDLLKLAKGLFANGVALSFHGKRTALEIAKRVRPRQMRRETKLHVGSAAEQSRNLLIEGENLQAMVTLYKYRGEVDLILTDPPYNTGQTFRYNDRWDSDPNDPDLGTIVSKEDGSRHTKWIKSMMPRLQMMKAMLKSTGVIAICIDDNELFHLGMMMDEVFGEDNRLGIINWQKAYSPKNDAKTVSRTTEYVLVYAKDRARAVTGRVDLDRGAPKNLDNDPDGAWIPSDPTARQHRKDTAYAIQSPFTGNLHYPNGEFKFDGGLPEARSHWVNFTKASAKKMLAEWGSEYVEKDIGDGRGKALLLKTSSVSLKGGYDPTKDRAVAAAAELAHKRREAGNWPALYFRDDKARKPGRGRPRLKNYVHLIKEGKVPTTFWEEEQYGEPLEIGSGAWAHAESGHTDLAKRELDAVVGKDHGFDTVKPLRLLKKIVQIWCPNDGLVMDPYAGSGSTGHALLELNHEIGSSRRFILIEQGAPENGDKYARTLTWRRMHNAITGERPEGRQAEPLGGGFEFRMLTRTIDARAVMTMKRDELIDVVLTSHWETHRRTAPNLQRFEEDGYQYLIGRDEFNEGYFLVWNNGGPIGTLDVDSYKIVTSEAKKAGLRPPFHVYARYEDFQSPNVRFWKIPDKILAHLGLDENESFNSTDGEAA